jgi:cysteine-S-conjugate beta-lyase
MTDHDPLLDLLHEDRSTYNGSFNPPIYRTSTFNQDGFEIFANGAGIRPPNYVYTRVANPTTRVLEEMIAKLENTDDGQAFGSGMGAITAALLALLGHGDHVLCIDSVYFPARQFLTDLTARMQLEVEYFAPDADLEALIRPNTRLIYLESPTTFKFEVLDLPKIAGIAKAHGIPTIIDNTWATPLFQKPLDFGIDISLHSGTKYINGHSDICLGLLATSHDLMAKIRPMAVTLGATLSPEDAFLAIRGLRTLAVRMPHHHASGLKIAEWLDAHPLVTEVRHPGLASSPYHALAKTQMSGYSGLFAFTLKAAPEGAIRAFTDALTMFGIAPSWGGFESLIVPINAKPNEPLTVRLSIGLEPVDTLIGDLEQAINCYGDFLNRS